MANELLPEQLYCTETKSFRVFWSQNSSSDDVREKIKSAFCNFHLSRLNGLIQFWAPVTTKTTGGRFLLSTSNQPFALENLGSCFHDYRRNSVKYFYSIDANNNNNNLDNLSGAPATAFLNRLAIVENLRVHQEENPLIRSALECELTTSLLLPVFTHPSRSSRSSSCVGVIECCVERSCLIVIFIELKRAIESVGLSTFDVDEFLPYKSISGLKLAKCEIEDALETVCELHLITLAQVWITFKNEHHVLFSSSIKDTQMFAVKLVGYFANSHDDRMLFFNEYSHTCDVIPLKIGDGLVGKTFQTYEPHFCRNIHELKDTGLLPLVPEINQSGCFVICLRSVHTGDVVDYAFEFLWPQNRDNFILLESLLLKLKTCLPSFEFACGAQLGDELRVVDVENSTGTGIGFFNLLQGNKNRLQNHERRVLVADEYCISSSRQDIIKQEVGTTEAVCTLKRKRNVVGISEWKKPNFINKKLSDTNQQVNMPNQDQSSNSNSLRCPGNDELIIEAEYEDDRTVSYLPITSEFVEIKKNIEEKYKLVSGSYKLQFLDFENEWLRLDNEGDWESGIRSCKTACTQTIRLRVRV